MGDFLLFLPNPNYFLFIFFVFFVLWVSTVPMYFSTRTKAWLSFCKSQPKGQAYLIQDATPLSDVSELHVSNVVVTTPNKVFFDAWQKKGQSWVDAPFVSSECHYHEIRYPLSPDESKAPKHRMQQLRPQTVEQLLARLSPLKGTKTEASSFSVPKATSSSSTVSMPMDLSRFMVAKDHKVAESVRQHDPAHMEALTELAKLMDEFDRSHDAQKPENLVVVARVASELSDLSSLHELMDAFPDSTQRQVAMALLYCASRWQEVYARHPSS